MSVISYTKAKIDELLAGKATLSGNGTIPDNQIPASIARDTEVATAVDNASAYDRARVNHVGTQDASTIGSGIFAPARLAAGTPAAGKYPDGSGNWTALPSAGTATTDASQLTSGTLPPARIGDASIADAKLASGTSLTAAERTKLSGIATGATANSTDAQLRDRSTHTGTQAISTISSLQSALDAKADDIVVEVIVLHDGSAGGGTRPSGYARVRWVNPVGTTYSRPTNMVAGDIWEHDA